MKLKRLALIATDSSQIESVGQASLRNSDRATFLVTNEGESVIKTAKGLWRVTEDGDVVRDDPRGDEARLLEVLDSIWNARFRRADRP